MPVVDFTSLDPQLCILLLHKEGKYYVTLVEGIPLQLEFEKDYYNKTIKNQELIDGRISTHLDNLNLTSLQVFSLKRLMKIHLEMTTRGKTVAVQVFSQNLQNILNQNITQDAIFVSYHIFKILMEKPWSYHSNIISLYGYSNSRAIKGVKSFGQLVKVTHSCLYRLCQRLAT